MRIRGRTTLAVIVLAAIGAVFGAVASADLPAGAQEVARIPIDGGRGMVDTGFGSVWVANGPSGIVDRIDPASNTVLARISVGQGIFGLRTGDGAVWVTNSTENTLSRIDPATNTVVAVVPVGVMPTGLAVTPGAVWVANHWGDPTGSVSRVDPTTNTVAATIPLGALPYSGPKFIVAAAGSIWVGVPNLSAVVRVSTVTNAIEATIPVKGSCSGIAASGDAVWVAGGGGPGCAPGLTRISTATDTVVDGKINAGGNEADVAVGLGSVWYTAYKSQFIGRVDPASSVVTSVLKTSGTPTGITIGFASAWAIDQDENVLLRLDPIGGTP